MQRKTFAAVLGGLTALALVVAGVAVGQQFGNGQATDDGTTGAAQARGEGPPHAMLTLYQGEAATVTEYPMGETDDGWLVAQTVDDVTLLVEETVVGVTGDRLLVRECVEDVGTAEEIGVPENETGDSVQQTVVGVYGGKCTLVEEPIALALVDEPLAAEEEPQEALGPEDEADEVDAVADETDADAQPGDEEADATQPADENATETVAPAGPHGGAGMV